MPFKNITTETDTVSQLGGEGPTGIFGDTWRSNQFGERRKQPCESLT